VFPIDRDIFLANNSQTKPTPKLIVVGVSFWDLKKLPHRDRPAKKGNRKGGCSSASLPSLWLTSPESQAYIEERSKVFEEKKKVEKEKDEFKNECIKERAKLLREYSKQCTAHLAKPKRKHKPCRRCKMVDNPRL
jgi:hypothetical protein